MTSTRAGRAATRWAPYAVLGGALGAAAYVAMIDPNRPGHYPPCPFLAFTGYYCPVCGTLRMIHAVAHGHLAEGFGRNPLAFVTLILLGPLWLRWAAAAWRGRPLRSWSPRPWAIGAFTVIVIAFWALRNLPVGHALAP